MTIEEQLKEIINGKYKSIRAFTQEVDIPYSTVDTMLKRSIGGTGVSTVIKIFHTLGLDVESISSGELKPIKNAPAADSDEGDIRKQKLIHNYHKLNTDGQGKLVDYSDDLTGNPKYTEIKERPRLRTIPYSTIAASAGAGEDIDDNSWKSKDIPDIPKYAQADFAVRVHGDSMLPDYEDGDIVLVRQQEAIPEGAVGLFWVKGKGGVIKKMGRGELISLNPEYDNIPYDTNKGRCFGRVIGKLEEE